MRRSGVRISSQAPTHQAPTSRCDGSPGVVVVAVHPDGARLVVARASSFTDASQWGAAIGNLSIGHLFCRREREFGAEELREWGPDGVPGCLVFGLFR